MICNICPRRCGAERTETYGGGFCRMPAVPVIARAGLHLWEEPVLSGTRGSGAVFFSGCSLGCVYCQNHTISAEGVGKAVTTERLREIFRELIAQGAHNIDLITASHFVPFLLPALDEPLPVPVVFNCGGYERVETLRLLEGKVQIWLPDLKYGLEEPARRYSHAPDYFPVATEAIREMFRQVGPCRMEDGLLRQGGEIACLIKPQFEAGREKVGKKGVVRDPAVHLEVLEHFLTHAKESHFTVLGITYSPIRGPEGNIEYLGYLKKCDEPDGSFDLPTLVAESHSQLKD